MTELHEDLSALGNSAKANKELYQQSKPDPAILEMFRNPSSLEGLNPSGCAMSLNIVIREFTSLCPKTGQPDFATIVIDYIPDEWCVESKSLKLYMTGFRNFGEFHESCVNRICNDLVTLLAPKEMMVKGEFTPRGGIPFWPTASYSVR